jgi:flavin-dependent dehydrogenase
VGDAIAFVDPVFSSGVYLAMNGARLGAEVVDARLQGLGQVPQRARRYERTVTRGLPRCSWFIYSFTSPLVQRLFMGPKNPFRMQEAVISVLAGDLCRKTPLILALFKGVSYAMFAKYFANSWRGYLRRRRDAQSVFNGGTTPQDEATPSA